MGNFKHAFGYRFVSELHVQSQSTIFKYGLVLEKKNNMNLHQIDTLGKLRATDYQPQSIKEEIRSNLIKKLQNREQVFKGIIGFEKDY